MNELADLTEALAQQHVEVFWSAHLTTCALWWAPQLVLLLSLTADREDVIDVMRQTLAEVQSRAA